MNVEWNISWREFGYGPEDDHCIEAVIISGMYPDGKNLTDTYYRLFE